MRVLSTGLATAITSASVSPVWFVRIVASTGTVRLWTGLGDFSWNSETWTGAGNLGEISDIPDSTELAARGIRLALSGIPSEMVALAVGTLRQGDDVTVYLGSMGTSGALVDTPYEAFIGLVDVPAMEDGPESSRIVISVENRMMMLQRTRLDRYNDEDQQRLHPGDLGFAYVASNPYSAPGSGISAIDRHGTFGPPKGPKDGPPSHRP